MTRREALLLILPSFPLMRALALRAQDITPKAIDPDFVRMWDAAARDRPDVDLNRSSLVPAGEPGTPLTVRGQLFDADGRRSLAQAIVFAYQTDAAGHYNRAGQPGWRLKAWARTDAEGRFVLDTIHPGPYPGRSVAAHIHLGVDGEVGQRQTLEDVLFDDDPLVTSPQRDRSRAAGRFNNIVRVSRVDAQQQHEECDIMFRLTGEYVF